MMEYILKKEKIDLYVYNESHGTHIMMIHIYYYLEMKYIVELKDVDVDGIGEPYGTKIIFKW